MDSPVMLDTASKFGRGNDLDCEFPGFNFDDEGFGRRGDFRSHLDDLASRHPEFADHLLGSTWGDIPFPGSLKNRRRGSGSGNNYQSHQDEDVKSQASGSSAASGASAVSSHGDPEITRHDFQEPRKNPIPQYGLRNTVDIGQHQINMDNPQKINRNQRSMSAPPENRQDSQQQSEQPRFVSRVEITPQQQQEQQQQQSFSQQREKSPEPQQQKTQQLGNVRHIPIFVEGRDEPVISRNRDDVDFSGNSSPPQFQTPPQYQAPPQFQNPPQYQAPPTFQNSQQYQAPPTFHRPSHFNERFGKQNWPPQFEDYFPEHPKWGREEPERVFSREKPQQQSQQFQHPQYQQKQPQYQQSNPQYQQNHSQYQQQPQQQKNQQKQQQQQAQHPAQQDKQEPEVPKPKPPLPKDPLERVALVQQEVDSLTEQVKNYKGNSRKEKDYMYLDEMLTRELIKLDDIETEGKENVRLARKTAIKTIQESINLLESKVPLPGQEEQPQEAQNESVPTEPETEKQPEQALDNKPIPLPPGPQSLVPPKEEEKIQVIENNQAPSTENMESQPETSNAEAQVEPCSVKDQICNAEADVNKLVVEAEKTEAQVEAKVEEPSQNQPVSETGNIPETDDSSLQEVQETPKPAKSPKKVKKSKKPVPVSAEPIPLPGPNSSDMEAK